jgi:hypothetical protein
MASPRFRRQQRLTLRENVPQIAKRSNVRQNPAVLASSSSTTDALLRFGRKAIKQWISDEKSGVFLALI